MTDADGPAEGLIPERRSATVTIKDKPNSKATGNRIISGDAITDGDGLTNARFTYQWSKGLGTVRENLSTDSSYTVREQDKGDRIRLTVSFTDDEGFREELTTAPTAAVGRCG